MTDHWQEKAHSILGLSFCFDSILSLGYGIDLGLLSTKTNFNVREMRQQVEHSYLDLDLDVDVDL